VENRVFAGDAEALALKFRFRCPRCGRSKTFADDDGALLQAGEKGSDVQQAYF
jgi:hypothetical protein